MRALQPGHELLHGPRCIASLQAYLFPHVSKYVGVLHARCGPRSTPGECTTQVFSQHMKHVGLLRLTAAMHLKPGKVSKPQTWFAGIGV
jgi:hypothetical protein